MSAAILQQHQSEFFDFSDIIYSMQKTRGTSPQQQLNNNNNNSTINNTNNNNNNNKSIMKCGARNPQHPQLHQLHNCLPAGLNFGLPPPSSKNMHHNGLSFDSNNNSLLMDNLDLINHIGQQQQQQQQQQLPPSSPTNSSSSSMSTSSSSSSSNQNSHQNNGMNSFRAWAQPMQQQHQQPTPNMVIHNALQRTVSHPHHMVGGGHHMAGLQVNNMHLKFVDMLDVPQPLNGCGDAAMPNAAAALHRKLERTQSEPLPQQQQLNTSRYKTELCRPFEEAGECKYGDKCQFAHGMQELRNLQRHPRYKTELCRTFHSAGYCPYGPRCHFVHNADEVRNNPPPVPTAPQQQAHNMVSRTTSLQSSAALLANGVAIPSMGHLTLSPAMSMSTGSDRASPTGSLSMSPTNSMVNFFPDSASFPLNANFPFTNTKISTIIPSPPPSPRDLSPTPMMGHQQQQHHQHHLSSSSSTSSVLSAASSTTAPATQKGAVNMDMGDARLPVFNRLSSTIESAFNTLEI